MQALKQDTNKELTMSKLKDFLYKSSNVIIDAVAGATNESIQNKINVQSQKSAEKKQAKANAKKNK